MRWLDDLIGPVGLGVRPLVTTSRQLFLEGPRSVSAPLYWWRDGELTWLPVVHDETTRATEFHPPPAFVDLLQALA